MASLQENKEVLNELSVENGEEEELDGVEEGDLKDPAKKKKKKKKKKKTG